MNTTLTSRQFNQAASAAKRATETGPVVITDRGRPAHVLMTIEEYRRLTGAEGSIVDRLAMDDADAVAFDPPKARLGLRPADLS